MAEHIIDYDGYTGSTWWQNKWRGLSNRFFKYKRHLGWYIHTTRYKIELDFDKIPTDSIPILINNYNRLELLQRQIDWLLSLSGNPSIIIVDNDSTYPPLLSYYREISHPQVQVVYLKFNSWRLGAAYLAKKLLRKFEKIILTDSDLLPYSDTPKDVLWHLSALLDQYPTYNHIGLSLEIEDLPDNSPMKAKVIQHESQFWSPQADCLNEEVYIAGVDSTFAMYQKRFQDFSDYAGIAYGSTLYAPTCRLVPQSPAIFRGIPFLFIDARSFATWATQLKKEAGEEKETLSQVLPKV